MSASQLQSRSAGMSRKVSPRPSVAPGPTSSSLHRSAEMALAGNKDLGSRPQSHFSSELGGVEQLASRIEEMVSAAICKMGNGLAPQSKVAEPATAAVTKPATAR